MEYMDLLDRHGNPSGITLQRGRPVPPGLYYTFVQVFITNGKRRLLVQKRSKFKRTYPGVWAVTGGIVSSGEGSREAAHRELLEEVGIDIPPERLRFVKRIRMPHAFLDVWAGHTEMELRDMKLQPTEVDDVRFVSAMEFLNLLVPDMGKRDPVYYGMLLEYLQTEGLVEIRSAD